MKRLLILSVCIAFICCKGRGKEKSNKVQVEKVGNSVTLKIKEEVDSAFVYSSLSSASDFGEYIKFVDVGESSFEAQLNLPQIDIDSVFFGYEVYVFKNNEKELLERGFHRGKCFPELPLTAEKLSGKLIEKQIYSEGLDEKRTLTIYEPPGFNMDSVYPVLFCADGEKIEYWAGVIDTAISSGDFNPLLIVGVHNKLNDTIDYRAVEYLKDYGLDLNRRRDSYSKAFLDSVNFRHTRLMNFFGVDVSNYMKKNYRVTSDIKKRVFYGYSNGGAFGVSLSREHYNEIGTYLVYSFGWGRTLDNPNFVESNPPHYFLCAGKFEKGFFKQVNKWKETLEQHKIPYSYHEYMAGHEQEMWKFELVKNLKVVMNTTNETENR